MPLYALCCPRTQVLGCLRSMASERKYYQRHMICELHLKCLTLVSEVIEANTYRIHQDIHR